MLLITTSYSTLENVFFFLENYRELVILCPFVFPFLSIDKAYWHFPLNNYWFLILEYNFIHKRLRHSSCHLQLQALYHKIIIGLKRVFVFLLLPPDNKLHAKKVYVFLLLSCLIRIIDERVKVQICMSE